MPFSRQGLDFVLGQRSAVCNKKGREEKVRDMALSQRMDIRQVLAAAVFAATTSIASPLYLAVLSEQTASDAAWPAVEWAKTKTFCSSDLVVVPSDRVVPTGQKDMEIKNACVTSNWPRGGACCA